MQLFGGLSFGDRFRCVLTLQAISAKWARTPGQSLMSGVFLLTTYAGEFFTEMMSKGDQRDAVKRSGLYYLLKLQTLQPGE